MAANDKFQWLRPPFMLVPYQLNAGLYKPEDLVAIYKRLKDEGLWEAVFHDNPQMNLLDFMEFFSMPSVMLQVINIVEGESITDMGAIAWLSGVEQYGDKQRAVANFCVFRDYQNPAITDPMAKFVFSYWFECLEMDVVVGMTPAANAPAVSFIKRVGFHESCRIPNYCFYKGEVTDCVISFMDKPKYTSFYGG
jgi:RimJ/RimL family protein N-acetyltransferase